MHTYSTYIRHLRVPVAVEEDDGVRGEQVDALAAGPGGQAEDRKRAAGLVELVYQHLHVCMYVVYECMYVRSVCTTVLYLCVYKCTVHVNACVCLFEPFYVCMYVCMYI